MNKIISRNKENLLRTIDLKSKDSYCLKQSRVSNVIDNIGLHKYFQYNVVIFV